MGFTNTGLLLMFPWPAGGACSTPFGPSMVFPAVRSEYRGVNVSALFVVPCTSKSMLPCETSVAPGPGWLRVYAVLVRKMLLNSATGLEKSGRVAGFGYWAT